MNEEDRKAFEEWIGDLPGCDRRKAWQAALEYERSRHEQPMTVEQLAENLRSMEKLPANLRLESQRNCALRSNKWEGAIYRREERIAARFKSTRKLLKLLNGARQRIAELESQQPKSEPERSFVPCPNHPLVTQLRAQETGEEWTHCPWCGSPLWRERTIITIERDAIASKRESSKDGWYVADIASYPNGKLLASDGNIRAKAVITFVEEL